jgi:predicted transcriptional regulator
MRGYAERNGPLTREEIVNALRNEPGLTKSQICRLLDLSWGTISHHARLLEAQGRIERRAIRHRTRFFAQGMQADRLTSNPAAHDPLAAPLLEAVVANPGIGIRDLAASLSVDRRAIRRHLDLLIESGLVAQTRAYRPQFFVIEQALANELIGKLRRRDPDEARR